MGFDIKITIRLKVKIKGGNKFNFKLFHKYPISSPPKKPIQASMYSAIRKPKIPKTKAPKRWAINKIIIFTNRYLNKKDIIGE